MNGQVARMGRKADRPPPCSLDIRVGDARILGSHIGSLSESDVTPGLRRLTNEYLDAGAAINFSNVTARRRYAANEKPSKLSLIFNDVQHCETIIALPSLENCPSAFISLFEAASMSRD